MQKEWYTIVLENRNPQTNVLFETVVLAKIKSKGLAYIVFENFKTIYLKENGFTLIMK